MKMKFLRIALFISILTVGASAQLDTSSQHFYMYIYFLGELDGARIALSTDGVTFWKYNNGEAVIEPEVAVGADPLMRDPCTLFDPKTGYFHLVWTTDWSQDNIGYSSSKDLINWSKQVMIPVTRKVPGVEVSWAPELFYDDLKDSVMVYWSTSRGEGGKEAFCCYTKDFIHFSAPRVYFEPHNDAGKRYTVIDETIVKMADSVYYMFFKDERKASEAGKKAQNIHYVMAKTPEGDTRKGDWRKGTWDEVSSPITPPGYEGPTAIIIGDELKVYSDPFMDFPSTNRVVKASVSTLTSNGLFTFQASAFTEGEAMKTVDGDDFLVHHGSMSEIPKAKALKLLYGTPDLTVYPETYTPATQDSIVVEAPRDPVKLMAVAGEEKVYPMGKQNCGCGTGVGLAFFPPIVIKAMAFRRRKKKKTVKNS